MGVGQRQQHAGMVVGVFRRIAYRTVHVKGSSPAAPVGAAARHEVQPMGDQQVCGAVPAACLGHSKAIHLPRHGAHALRSGQRHRIEAQSLMEPAMAIIDPHGRPQRQRFLEQPVPHPPAPCAAFHHPIVRGREPRFQPAALFELLHHLAHILAVRHRGHEGRVRGSDHRRVLQPHRRQKPTVAADVGILAIDGDDIANSDIAVFIRRPDIEQGLP